MNAVCPLTTELGLLSGVAAILRFPIADPDDTDEIDGQIQHLLLTTELFTTKHSQTHDIRTLKTL